MDFLSRQDPEGFPQQGDLPGRLLSPQLRMARVIQYKTGVNRPDPYVTIVFGSRNTSVFRKLNPLEMAGPSLTSEGFGKLVLNY